MFDSRHRLFLTRWLIWVQRCENKRRPQRDRWLFWWRFLFTKKSLCCETTGMRWPSLSIPLAGNRTLKLPAVIPVSVEHPVWIPGSRKSSSASGELHSVSASAETTANRRCFGRLLLTPTDPSKRTFWEPMLIGTQSNSVRSALLLNAVRTLTWPEAVDCESPDARIIRRETEVFIWFTKSYCIGKFLCAFEVSTYACF